MTELDTSKPRIIRINNEDVTLHPTYEQAMGIRPAGYGKPVKLLSIAPVTLQVGGIFQLLPQVADVISYPQPQPEGSVWLFRSVHPHIANVSPDGLITGRTVGTTSVEIALDRIGLNTHLNTRVAVQVRHA